MRRARAGERGSAIVEFVAVGALVILVFLALVQLALVLHVRNLLQDSAAEGARYGAASGATLQDAVARTRLLIDAALPASYADAVTARHSSADGVGTVVVDVTAPTPVLGLLSFGPTVSVTARAIDEDGLP